VPRLHLPAEHLDSERVVLQGESHKYLTRVLRLRAGDPVTIFDGQGQEVEARIDEVSARSTMLVLGARRRIEPRAGAALTLIQAVSRGERMDLVVQKATELGVSAIVPVWTERTVVQAAGDGRLRRWRTIAQEAARQCGRADLPIIAEPRALAAALAEAPTGAAAAPGRLLMLWEESTGTPLRRALAGDERAVTLLVGAEGGFTAGEAEAARAAGFETVGLGPRILRTETAAIAALAIVQSALGALD
jgi:16S rRNA (uracil1498-N3)-methyltransferase